MEDARVRFRTIFCELLNQKRKGLDIKVGCTKYLWKLNDEPTTIIEQQKPPKHDPNLIIFIVPGAFHDCIPELGIPYPKATENLGQLGYTFKVVNVKGLSSSPFNADIIAEAVAEWNEEPSQKLVLMGYSKGTTDILHFLATHPKLAGRVSAVLSVAGAVNGSALADRYAGVDYDNWLARRIPGKCQSGDSGALDSLSRTLQFQWLATHPLPEQVRYFSLAAFARYDDVQLHLRSTYKLLEKISPLNDGQLLMIDQLIPGSTLLGYINADHWTVAIPVEEKFSDWNPEIREEHQLLRGILFEAMMLFLSERLNGLQ
jgi:pimeloyl-ACP methyl ester carboxylesterase